jgi:hypothetical protein
VKNVSFRVISDLLKYAEDVPCHYGERSACASAPYLGNSGTWLDQAPRIPVDPSDFPVSPCRRRAPNGFGMGDG